MPTDEHQQLREAVRQCEERLARMTELVDTARHELVAAEAALRSRTEAELRAALEALVPELGTSVLVLDRNDQPVVPATPGSGLAHEPLVAELADRARRAAPAAVRHESLVAVAVGATEQFVVLLEP